MKIILAFDADNTLWDTDSVFKDAQIALLQTIANSTLLLEVESELSALREIDRALFVRLGRFEYNFEILSAGMAFYYTQNLSLDQATEKAIQYSIDGETTKDLENLIKKAHANFSQRLTDVPKLYPETENVLQIISNLQQIGNPLITVLLSEGKQERINYILKSHSINKKPLEKFFDEVVIHETKSKELFEEAKRIGLQHLPNISPSPKDFFIMIGDSIKRDIKFGNQTGYCTIYKPAPFLGHEISSELDEEPNLTIKSLTELPEILNDLGILSKSISMI